MTEKPDNPKLFWSQMLETDEHGNDFVTPAVMQHTSVRLRDLFAAAALAGYAGDIHVLSAAAEQEAEKLTHLKDKAGKIDSWRLASELAYQVADAMLAEREKTG